MVYPLMSMMHRASALLVALLLGALAGAAERDVSPVEAPPAGARGVCITEMDGGELVEIPLTVLGSVGPSAPEMDLVLVRLDDERFAHTGIIAGMSGSPVYVDGVLLGALAYGWSFSKEPIGGVTPWRRMQTLGDAGAPAGQASVSRPELLALVEAARQRRLGRTLADWLLPAAVTDSGLHPLPLPMAGSLLPASGWLGEVWQRLGFMSAPASGGGGAASDSPLAPGRMVAGVMVSGDASIAAAGTVTAIDGDRLWAFGHPFLGGGSAMLPLARASVVAVMPSQAVSFKMFSVGEMLGELTADRAHGIGGRLGPAAAMVPVAVEVDGRSYRFAVPRHPTLLPLLVAYLTQSSHSARGRTFGDQTVAMAVEMAYAGGRRALLEDVFAGPEAPFEAAGLAAAVVAFLENSSHQPPDLERMTIRLTSTEEVDAARILEVVPSQAVVSPGDTLHVKVRIQPFRGEAEWLRLSVPVPDRVAAVGQLDLVVADGASWSAYELRARPQRPASFDDELRLVARLRPSNRLIAALEVRDPGVVLGAETRSTPAGIVLQLGSGLGGNLQTVAYGIAAETELATRQPLSGALRVPLKVRIDGRGTSATPEAP